MSTAPLRHQTNGHARRPNGAKGAAPGPAVLALARDEANANTRAVIDVLQVTGQAKTAAEAAVAALNAVRAAFGWDYGSFWTLEESGQAMLFASESGVVNAAFQEATRKGRFQEGQGLVGGAWQRRDMHFVEDLRAMNGFGRAAAAEAAGLTSAICLPLIIDQKVVGALDFFARQHLSPGPERLEAIRSIGRLVSQAIERLQESERQEERNADTLAINKVLGNAARPLNPLAFAFALNPASRPRLLRSEPTSRFRT